MKGNSKIIMLIIVNLALSFLTLNPDICIASSSYKGLIPGYSTLEDTYQILGKPVSIKTAGKGKNYHFKNVVVNFAGSEEIINTIQIVKDFSYVSPNGISLNQHLARVTRSIKNPIIKNNVVIDTTQGVIYWLKDEKVKRIVLASGKSFKKSIRKKDLNRSICIVFENHHSKVMTYMEVCKFRANGCLVTSKHKKKYQMHCLEKHLNDCDKNENWKTINELVGINNEIEIGRVSKNISVVNGDYSSQLCAHYDE